MTSSLERSAHRIPQVTAGLLFTVPVIFNAGFTLLSMRFSYPQILQENSDTILTRFHAEQSALLPGCYALLFSAALLIPMSVLAAERWAHPATVGVARAVGVVAGIVQAMGLARWVFLVPSLATAYAGAESPQQQFVIATVFQAFHRYAGMGLGEHLGYLFTALWTTLIAVGLWPTSRILSVIGLISALAILFGLLTPLRMAFASPINAIGYIVWSLWLIALGVQTLRTKN